MVCLFRCTVSIIYKYRNQSQIVYCSKILWGLVVLLQALFVLFLSSLLCQPLDLFSEYCLEHGIPFPSTELSQEEREHLKECYVFEDSLEAPILAYFPLVCDTFQKYKAPSKLTAVIIFLRFSHPVDLLNWFVFQNKTLASFWVGQVTVFSVQVWCIEYCQLIRDWNEEV